MDAIEKELKAVIREIDVQKKKIIKLEEEIGKLGAAGPVKKRAAQKKKVKAAAVPTKMEENASEP